MSTIIMNILAYLAILALVGGIAAIGLGVLTALRMVKTAKAAARAFDSPRQRIGQIVNVCKGIYLKSQGRLMASASHVGKAADSVMHTKDSIFDAASKLDLGDAVEATRSVADHMRQDFDAAKFVAQLLKTIREAGSANA